jgi:membrane carboxypeptidase/penicillin-binding protein PbpC
MLLLIASITTTINWGCYGQSRFIQFDTQGKGTRVCEGKAFGVIAIIAPDLETINAEWVYDPANFSKANKEVALVNTSTPGEKKLQFRLTLNNHEKYDTSLSVRVLPNPKVELKFTRGKLSVTYDRGENATVSWFVDGTPIPGANDKILKNPTKGVYQVLVTDNNGCKGRSQRVTIE